LRHLKRKCWRKLRRSSYQNRSIGAFCPEDAQSQRVSMYVIPLFYQPVLTVSLKLYHPTVFLSVSVLNECHLNTVTLFASQITTRLLSIVKKSLLKTRRTPLRDTLPDLNHICQRYASNFQPHSRAT
jgi:hypothetical protein